MRKTRLLLAASLALGLGVLLTTGLGFSRAAPSKAAIPTPEDGGPIAKADAIVLGMGCFWGTEKRMAELPGFDPAMTTLAEVPAKFWESHDPTQGDRQGNDAGSNYRSAIYTNGSAQERAANNTRAAYQDALTKAGRGTITTEIAPLSVYFRAEDYHQDYLQKNPRGCCGLGGTGIAYPTTGKTAPGTRTMRSRTACLARATSSSSSPLPWLAEATPCPSRHCRSRGQAARQTTNQNRTARPRTGPCWVTSQAKRLGPEPVA